MLRRSPEACRSRPAPAGYPATVKLRVDDLTAERHRCRQDLGSADDDASPITHHPAALETYARDLGALAKGLGEAFADGDAAAVDAFRSLVDHVVVEPSKAGDRVSVTVQGRLALLLDHDLFPSVAVPGGSVVAEEGLEPPTRGL